MCNLIFKIHYFRQSYMKLLFYFDTHKYNNGQMHLRQKAILIDIRNRPKKILCTCSQKTRELGHQESIL